MSKLLTPLADWFFGRGSHAVTVPSMDGALRPNSGLDQAVEAFGTPEADNLVRLGFDLLLSSGAALLRWRPDTAAIEVDRFEADITALCPLSDGQLAVALDGGEILLWQGQTTRRLLSARKAGLQAITALVEMAPGQVALANGSSKCHASEWTADLMQRNAAGSVHRLEIGSDQVKELASGLAWPAGLAVTAEGLAVSEAWTHRVVLVPKAGGAPKTVLAHLPGYPGRLQTDGQGGYWLCVFAPRSQLIEMVLRERAYRVRMMAEVPRDLWMAPAYRSGVSFKEPLQGGALKQLGILKPWAPTRSYGLLVRLDAKFSPTASLHSRADGKRHGVTSAAVDGEGRLYACSRGAGLILDCGFDAEDTNARAG